MLNYLKNMNYKLVGIIFFISLTYSLPIIIADRYYIDDLGRSIYGYYEWSSNGRPIADIIMKLLHFNLKNIDISPIPLFISLIIHSIISVIYIKSMKIIDDSKSVIFISIGFIISPFLLENLSYKYDVLPMLFSINILMVVFFEYQFKFTRWLIGIMCLLMSLCSYQASISTFICMSAIEFLVGVNRIFYNKDLTINIFDLYIRIFERIIQLVISYIIYTKLILPFLDLSQYTLNNSEIINFDQDGFDILMKNIYIFMYKIYEYFSIIPNYIIFLIFSCIIGYFFWITNIILIDEFISVINKFFVILTIFFIPIIFLFSSFLHLSFFKYLIFSPRILISFSYLIGAVFILFSISNKWLKTFSIIPMILLILFSFIYSYSYGNSLKVLKNHENNIALSIASNIKLLDPSGSKKIQIDGIINYPEQVNVVINELPSMKDLLFVYLNNNWWWGYIELRQYGINNNIANLKFEDIENLKKNFTIIQNGNYSISEDKTTILIYIK